MSVEVALFNAVGLLPAALEVEIRGGIDDGIATLRRHLDVAGVGIVVLLTGSVDPETAMGGRAYGPDACEIRVDEASPALSVCSAAIEAKLQSKPSEGEPSERSQSVR